jgi:hypothetical protein
LALNRKTGRIDAGNNRLRSIVERTLQKMADLSIEVRHHEIIVSEPKTGRSVTYRWNSSSRMLEALCEMRSDPDTDTLKFVTEAWKAAYAKAKVLGWF